MGLSRRLLNWARVKSPWMIVFNSGACNGCDIEIIATLTPRYDMERFGMMMTGSPRHADILIVTGPVTLKQAPRLRRIWEQMPEPKYVIAMGPCGANGGPFRGLYHVMRGVDKVIPVDIYIAGCPPRPDEIMDGIAACMQLMNEDGARRTGSRREAPTHHNLTLPLLTRAEARRRVDYASAFSFLYFSR